ncbi:phage tail assembly chaperone G [Pantoea cypripedii]|uniref:Phage minor tail protein G n=1 Tax=Pantoea cypripedii TaxID=55209 RepID=A0A1X1ET05_PANCY|nr:phage minor tail protein G [Pantoea cypripedii]MBP2197224.1 phage minor tail protein G [Pantoea cypripedii]ORM93148.1 phage minor tail protein G [Pantoea cypripedii]
MFLKKEEFTFNGESVTVSELSALQRIEMLEYLAREERAQKSVSENEPEEVKAAGLVGVNIRAGARLVAMSLWHGTDKTLSVDDLHQQVLETWPVEAIGKADTQVKLLSGMIKPVTSDEEAAEDTAEEEAEPESLQKS